MKFRTLVSLFSVFLTGLIVAVSCTLAQKTTSGTNTATTVTATTPIQMGFSAWTGWIPWQVAQDEKLFDANNVKVDLK